MKQQILLPTRAEDQVRAISEFNNVILFGAGLFASPAIIALTQYRILPSCICDNSSAKQNQLINDIRVISPTEAWADYPEAAVIITTAPKYIDEIRFQLLETGWKDIFDCSFLLSLFEYDRLSISSGVSKLHYDLDNYFIDYFHKYYPDKLVIPSIDIMITEKCSLRCRDCSNLMQYYTNPKDVNFAKLFDALDILMHSVDHVLEFRVLGGEAFMNRQAYRYVNRLRKYDNYTRIAVYANGTIVPSGENLDCLMHDDTYLRISDYGAVSPRAKEMAKLFDDKGIVYDFMSSDNWQDCAVVEKRERTQSELEVVFSACCASNTLTLLDGNLYVCPFAANAANLEMLPNFSDEHLVIDERSSRQNIREWLFNLLRVKTYTNACEYCAGRPLDDTPLPAAIQTPTPLPYRKL